MSRQRIESSRTPLEDKCIALPREAATSVQSDVLEELLRWQALRCSLSLAKDSSSLWLLPRMKYSL
jgi:hypothetical protein